MTKDKQKLDELLSDPIVRLLMARDHVSPEYVRMLVEKAQNNTEQKLAPHVIDQSYKRRRPHA